MRAFGFYKKKRWTAALLSAAMTWLLAMPALAGTAASGIDLSTYMSNVPGAGSAVSGAPSAGSTAVQLQADQTVGSKAATVQSAEIDAQNPQQIVISVDAGSLAAGGEPLYLFSIKSYQMDLSGRSDYLAVQSAGSGTMYFTAGLQDDFGQSRIYDAFVVATKSGSGYEIVSNRCYVGNPERIAQDQSPALNPGKKGLQVDPNLLDDAIDLGIKHAFVAFSTAQLFGSGLSYSYEGRTYSFDAAQINSLDQEIRRLSDAGIAVTFGLVNGWSASTPDLYRPGTTQLTSDAALYYNFNVETEDGYRLVKAMASFLANRYNGQNGCGKITNWVIGNEINNQYWNYAGNYDAASYTRIFQRSFRVFYTAIKSVSANANVMFSLDQYWTIPPESGSVGKYAGKDVLDAYAYLDQAEGKTNWALAIHPYPYPLTDPNFWNDLSSGKVTNDITTPVVSYANLSVLTNYMHTANMLDRNGQVRSIFMTEQGFSSVKNLTEDASLAQAAAVAYGHYIVENNPDIDAYMLQRQCDNTAETSVGLYFGLSGLSEDGSVLIPKLSHEVFKYIDDPAQSASISEFAKSVIGITNWSELIPNFHY